MTQVLEDSTYGTAILPVLTMMQRLRHETQEAHAAIEQVVDLLSPTLTWSAYRRVLERYRGFYAPIEQRLAAFDEWSGMGLDLAARRKVGLLDADLVELGCAQPANLRSVTAATMPRLSSFDEALGCAYVLEGATLGGRLISRHIQHVLGITPTLAGRFLACYGERSGAMWRGFGAALDAYASARGDAGHIVLGARQTFCSFTLWLQGDRVE